MKHINRRSVAGFVAAALIAAPFLASAATTISTDINTGGSLTVAGISTLGANITIPASYSFDVASAGVLNIGTTTANAITIANTNVLTTFRGPVKITGAASTTGDFSVNGNATTTAASGNIATQGSVTVGTTLTLANSSTAIGGIVFGTCSISNSATITASSSAFFNCTGATGVTSSHKVFVQATSSLPAQLIVQAASSTPTAGTINLQIFNTGGTGGTSVAPGAISLNFFGIR